jgi:hypothetical protein
MKRRPSSLDPEPVRTDEAVDFSFLRPLIPTPLFTIYWRFAAERQRIFLRRLSGSAAPWTSDAVLKEYKFTNAYRASDRVSQYLIRRVIYNDNWSHREMFFRTLLFKLFNRIETWELLEQKLGPILFQTYSFGRYEKQLSQAKQAGRALYSAAYVMPSDGPDSLYEWKHQMNLRLLENMMNDDLPQKLEDAPSMQAAFVLLQSYPTIGDFLAYQYVIDLNYGPLTSFSEMDFVVPGPGARSGMKKCFQHFGGHRDADIIRIVTDTQEECFRAVGASFPTLWGRKLQLVDCQNLFCEIDKYTRNAYPSHREVAKKKRIKQKFKATLSPLKLWYPPKWQINERLSETPSCIPS